VRDEQVVDVHAEFLCVETVECVLGVDEGCDAARLLRFGDGVDGQRTGFDNPEGCIGQGKNMLGMHVLSKYLVDVVED
jgi:hypothetical protein